jgi:hypothetical protein
VMSKAAYQDFPMAVRVSCGRVIDAQLKVRISFTGRIGGKAVVLGRTKRLQSTLSPACLPRQGQWVVRDRQTFPYGRQEIEGKDVGNWEQM